MKLLISTPLHLFLFDPSSSQLSLVRTGDGYYYGISYRQGAIVLSSTDGRLKYFRRGEQPFQSKVHLVQPHQVEWVEDNKILAANTGKNCISVFDARGNLERDVYLNEITLDDKDSERRGNHFNSIHKVGTNIHVVAHNYDRPSEVYELSWPNLEVVRVQQTVGNWAHNVWICEFGALVCDSKRGSLISADNGEVLWSAGENLISRGLAASEDYIFVGSSQQNARQDRFWKTGGVWIVDRKTLKTVDHIQFPGSGDVHEIRLVDVVDDCHTEQVLYSEDLIALRQISPLVALGYALRKKYIGLQKEVFPISALVRAEQTIMRWTRAKSYLENRTNNIIKE